MPSITMKTIYKITGFLTILLLLSCSNSKKKSDIPFWTADTSPEKTGRLITEDLLARPDFMMYLTPNITSIHYAEACAAYGALRLAGVLHDSALLNRIIERYSFAVDSGLISSRGHVDINVYGILPLEIYMQTGNKKFLKEGKYLADKQWENPLPNGMTDQTRYWIDDIYMIASLQIQAFRATGDEIYLDRAALEVDNYLRKLQQANGLFYHGENAPFFWGRGNGWVAAGLAELISELPASHPYYSSILEGYKKMMAALVHFQDEEGMWHQLIDYPDAWKETSCSAMFGYAILQGVKQGILTDEIYTEAYRKSWLALCGYVDESGKLADVCVGTGQSKDENYYLERNRVTGDLHGQAPMLWFAASLLEKEE